MPASPAANPAPASARPFKLPALLITALLVAAPLFVRVGSGSLQNGDDAMFAEAARHAARNGELLRYSWDGARLDYRYGPLHMLALRSSISLLDDSELAARLPAALAALLCLLAVGLLGRSLVPEDQRRCADAAMLLSALALLCSGHFYRAARAAGTDAALAAFSVLAMLAYVRSWRAPRAIYLSAVALGAAALTKGVLALLPLLPIGVDWLLAPRDARPPLKHSLAALALFIGLAASWHVYQASVYGHAFVDTYFVYNLIGRASGIAGLGLPEPFLSQVLDREGFAVLLAAAALAYGVARARAQRGVRLSLIWAVAGLLPLLISRTRLPQYLLPALPPLALLAGLMLARALAIGAQRRADEASRDVGPSALLSGLLAALLLGLFASNNLSRWLAPDFTPGLKTTLAALPRRSAAPRLIVYNDYHAAARYYADRPTRLVTDSKRAFALLTGSRAMREANVVEHVARARLSQRLARERPIAVLTTLLFARPLARAIDALPEPRRKRIARVANGGYVLFLERSAAGSAARAR